MMFMLTACGTTVTPEQPEVTQPSVTQPAEPEFPLEPEKPTYAEVAKYVEVTTSDLKLMPIAGMDMWYNKVNVSIAGRSDIAGLVVRVYYYGNNKNVLKDSYDDTIEYMELECSGYSEVYEVIGFYNPNVTRARAVISRIVMQDGTVLENAIEL